MPRKPKGAMDLDGETLLSLFHTTKDPIPATPEFLRAIIRALVIRIERYNPKDAVLLKYHLQQLVLLEERVAPLEGLLHLHHDGMRAIGEDIQKEVDTRLVEMVSDEAGRHSHFLPILRLQHTVLVNYLDEYQCPVDHMARQERWIAEHREMMWAVLTPFKCYCTYPTSLDDMNLDDREWTRTSGNLVSLILAHLHQSTPATIGKLLSHSKPQ